MAWKLFETVSIQSEQHKVLIILCVDCFTGWMVDVTGDVDTAFYICGASGITGGILLTCVIVKYMNADGDN